MSSIDRPLAGDVLILSLDEALAQARDPAVLERSGRSARTLFKQGTLRTTVVVLAPGGEMAEHQAPGPIMVQAIEGRIRFSLEGEVHEIGPGQLLTAGAGVPHAVSSEEGGAFLLTVAHPDAALGSTKG
jgi:quercetin dioxygenase-like cupin family protein